MLAILACALAFLPPIIEKEQKTLQENRDSLSKSAKNYQPIKMDEFNIALSKATNIPKIILSGEHNLFAPVLWLIDANGQIVKVVSEKQVGPNALQITKITPLHYIISLERVSGNSYLIGITDEAALRPIDRRMKTRYVSMSSPKTEFFTLKEVKGDPANPEALVLELNDPDKTLATISKDNPYKKVQTYVADLKYSLENAVWTNRHTNDVISFAGDDYLIVDINPNGVVLLSQTSTRRFVVNYNPVP